MIKNGHGYIVFGSHIQRLEGKISAGYENLILQFQPSDQFIGNRSAVITYSDSPIKLCEIGPSNTLVEIYRGGLSGILNSFGIKQVEGLDISSFSASYTPLYLFILNNDILSTYAFVYASREEQIFVRVAEKPYTKSTITAQELIEFVYNSEAVDENTNYYINNHDTIYDKFEPDTEFEHKLNLSENSNIWNLHKFFYESFKKGDFEGFYPNPLWEFKRWFYENHLFEIIGSKEERGYISFIRKPDGNFISKHKIYSEDTYERIELRNKNVKIIDNDFDSYLSSVYPKYKFRQFPVFTRILYNMIIDSLDSGHNYALVFDRNNIVGSSAPNLVQCELEYYNSLGTITDSDDFNDELLLLRDNVSATLDKLGVSNEKIYYSKLTYLQDNC